MKEILKSKCNIILDDLTLQVTKINSREPKITASKNGVKHSIYYDENLNPKQYEVYVDTTTYLYSAQNTDFEENLAFEESAIKEIINLIAEKLNLE